MAAARWTAFLALFHASPDHSPGLVTPFELDDFAEDTPFLLGNNSGRFVGLDRNFPNLDRTTRTSTAQSQHETERTDLPRPVENSGNNVRDGLPTCASGLYSNNGRHV